ncbi:putative reverse transcriptase domain-containing protein [Tanacetum coccineum]
MSMMIYSSHKARILVAQSEASKGANSSAEMLKGLDKQFKRKEDGGLYVAKRIWSKQDVLRSMRLILVARNEEGHCYVCSKVKAEHKKPLGLLQQPEIPEWKWENITMDFIVKLPRTSSVHDAIWVIVDPLTKSAHFLVVREDFKTKKVGKTVHQ